MRQPCFLFLFLALGLVACQRNDAAPTPTPAAAPASPITAETPQIGVPAAAKPVASTPAAKRIETDVGALADDAHAGRFTGSAGYDQAADLVAARFAKLGLQPAGDDGTFFQQVKLLQSVRERDGAALVVHRNGRDIALRFGDQFLPAPGFGTARVEVKAPAVFVNQGIVAPALRRDDLAGLDLKDRIAVLYHGAPANFSHDQRALYDNDADKLRLLAARGAIGAVFVNSALDEARTPWADAAAAWQKPAMRLRDADGKPVGDTDAPGTGGIGVVASVSAAAADLLFADQPRSAAELFAAAQDGSGKGFVLPGTLTLRAHSRVTTLASRNVIARLAGSDPALQDAPVVVSAHLDALGTGKAVDDDNVYNGAVDNALGVAILLEAAQQRVDDKHASKRPLLFVATTGGEQGQLGAQYFVAHPPGSGKPVADLDLDAPVLMAPTTDVVAIGAAHSSLKTALDATAKLVDVAVSPDPFPEDGNFLQGDHAVFVRAGIPALYLTSGTIAADKARKPELALRYYLRNCYQRPCDDASQPIQYDDAARLARLAARLAQAVGDAKGAPAWRKDDPFGERFGGKPAQAGTR